MARIKKPVTLHDIAKKAGVSTFAVSMTLKGKTKGYVSNENQAKIRKAIKSLDYKPNFLARGLASGHTMRINFAIMEEMNMQMTIGHISDVEAYVAAIDYLSTKGYICNLIRLPSNKSAKEIIKIVNDSLADGTIFLRITESVLKNKIIKHKTLLRKPCVVIGSDARPKFPCTFFDWPKAFIVLQKYLADAAHKYIVIFWMRSGSEYRLKREMTKTINRGLRATFKTDLIIKEIEIEQDTASTAGRGHINRLFNSTTPPTAILSTANIMLPGIILGLEENNVKIPEQVEVLSIGDSSLARFISPKPSFIDLKGSLQAIEACNILIACCEGKQDKVEYFSVPIEIKHNQTTRNIL